MNIFFLSILNVSLADALNLEQCKSVVWEKFVENDTIYFVDQIKNKTHFGS